MKGITERRRWRRQAACLATVLLIGCGRAEEVSDASADAAADASRRASIEAMLREFLPALGDAYASGNIEPLRAWAVERVLANVEKRILDVRQEGMVIEPELQGLVIEEMNAWGNDFAVVTTLETWDLRYFSTGSHSLVSERLGTKNRVRYQLKKVDGRWRVFYRELTAELES